MSRVEEVMVNTFGMWNELKFQVLDCKALREGGRRSDAEEVKVDTCGTT